MPTQIAMRPARTVAMPTNPEDSLGGYSSGLAWDIAQLERVALRDRWGLALIGAGWIHMGIFLICQALYAAGDRAESHYLPLWGVDLTIACLIFRRHLIGPSRGPIPTLMAVVARVWVTFFVLAFSAATLNKLVGFETDWFKAVWASLSTFGFATMAWIFHLKFLVPAVQMSLSALLIARYPEYGYGIYGLTWCIALSLVGLELERRRAGLPSHDLSPSTRPRSLRRSLDVG